MYRSRTRGPGLRRAAAAIAAALDLHAGVAHAIGGDSDGWITPQPGHPLAIGYAIHEGSSKAYGNGRLSSGNARLDASVALLRYVHPVALGADLTWTPNIIVPLVDLRTGGSLAGLGDTRGVGDVMLISGFWPVHDYAARKHLAIVPYLWLPTGKYDSGAPLNIGENRFKAALQVGGNYPLGKQLDVAGSVDTTFFGRNSDTDLRQKPLTEFNGWLKYNLASASFAHVAVGLAHVTGGETRVRGVSQGDAKRTTTAKLQYGTLVDDSKTRHVLFTYARDLSVRSGLKVDNHVEVRYLQAF